MCNSVSSLKVVKVVNRTTKEGSHGEWHRSQSSRGGGGERETHGMCVRVKETERDRHKEMNSRAPARIARHAAARAVARVEGGEILQTHRAGGGWVR